MTADTRLAYSVALQELEVRAGASDEDREAWLAERRTGITATEVRDLYIRAKSTAKIAATKLGHEKERDLGFIPRIAYGKEREIFIADVMAGEGFAHETRVFHYPLNSRHLASPDGVAVTFDDEILVSEYKTDEHGMTPGDVAAADDDAFRASGYRIQVNWVMHVIGAKRARLAIEAVTRTPGGFEPGEIRRFWIERDDELIEELVELADAFLEALDDMAENGVDPVAVSLLEDAIASSAAAKDARDALETYCASTGLSSLRIPEGSMSYSTPAPRKTFQASAFKEAHPGMYQEFVEATPAGKPSLRVTPARSKAVTS